MQLVLGASVGGRPASAGAPLPVPPDRWRLGERGRRTLRRVAWGLAFVALALLGALHGATTAIGADGVGELASATPPGQPAPQQPVERDVRGSFWRPERSNAERPPAEVAPRRWQPQRSD